MLPTFPLRHPGSRRRNSFPFPSSAWQRTRPAPNGSLHARTGATSPGLVNNSLVGVLHPGTYRLTFPGLRVDPRGGQVSGHFIFARLYTVQVVSPWSSRSGFPLVGGEVDEEYSLIFEMEQPGICYTYCEYSGHGELALDEMQVTYIPKFTRRKAVEIHRVAHESQERPITAALSYSDLPAGHYRVGFDFTGSAFASFFDRDPAAIRTAAYAGAVSSDQLARLSSIWLSTIEDRWATVITPDYLRPLQEGVHPPWWLSIPFAADHHARNLRFALSRSGDVHVLVHYDGPADVDLTEIALYREVLEQPASM